MPSIDYNKESPFFIKDLVEKYDIKWSTIWCYIKYHSELFEKTGRKRETGLRGRPEYEWRVKQNAILN